MQVQEQVKARFAAAVENISARLQADDYVLAAVLYGSVARGEPWERSDIDMMIILRDGLDRDARHMWLVEDDLNISAELTTRADLKRALDSTLQGSMLHSIRSQFRLLFSKDDTITQWLSEPPEISPHDRQLQLLGTASEVFWMLDKAEKWFFIKRDLHYALLWTLMLVNSLAKIEVVLHGQAPHREALDQALRFNPAFFHRVYTGLIDAPKTEETIGAALAEINAYLEQHTQELFQPVLTFLANSDGLSTAAEMDQYFKKKLPGAYLGGAYEWLARKGIIQKVSAPVHLTRKSQVTLEAPAYAYDEIDFQQWE